VARGNRTHGAAARYIEPLPDIPFEADVTLQAMPSLAMLSGVICGSRSGRSRALLADGVDDFGLVMNLGGPYLASQGGRELVLADGEATVFSCAQINAFTYRPPGPPLRLLRSCPRSRTSSCGQFRLARRP
jgi:hypothetical protein